MEAAKHSDVKTVTLKFPCGAACLIPMGEIRKSSAKGSWAVFCAARCPKRYGLNAVFACDTLRAALPLKDFETAISWVGK